MNPPLPSGISAFEPPSPLEFPVTFCGGGVWIFSGTTHCKYTLTAEISNALLRFSKTITSHYLT